ncbi:MAG: type VII secretion protein EccCa, partial [Nakamurella sp.]
IGAVLLAVTQQSRPLLAAAGLLVLAASIIVGVVMVVGSRTGDRRRTREQRERYLDYLERVRQEARESGRRQLLMARLSHPPPTAAASAAQSAHRRWERRPGDADFLMLRIGLGTVPPARPLTLAFPLDDPLVSYDEVCLSAARTLLGQYTQLVDQPVCVPLAGAAAMSIHGARQRVHSAARALLAQLIWGHSPLEIGIVVISDHPAEEWDWFKWLPHSLSASNRAGQLGSRMFTRTIAQGIALLHAETDFGTIAGGGPARKLVVLVDVPSTCSTPSSDLAALNAAARAAAALQLHLVDRAAAEPDLVDTRVHIADDCTGTIEWSTAGIGPTRCSIDQLDVAEMILLARSFAPLRPVDDSAHPSDGRQSAMDSVRFVDVASLDPVSTWRPRAAAELMRVPIGVGADGALVVVDLKESATGGMGPHGLVIGATGSGKSELLRTLVTTLAISHPPDVLALLLADFKGGATFSGLATLPHIAGMVTNLEADLGLIDRFRDALSGELQRRQELLAAAGKVSSIEAYQHLQSDRPDLPTLPRLLVIVDEFSELLGAKPDLGDLFVTIGRIGRSIGIHLLLATQRLDIGRIRGLESHLSYRICLRTFSEAESREAIGSSAAYRLPAQPGWAYLVADSADPIRFRVSTVSRPHRPARPPHTRTPARILPFAVENDVAQRISDLSGATAFDAGAGTDISATWRQHQSATILDVAVGRLTTGARTHPRGHPVRPVWLEPLPSRLEIGALSERAPNPWPKDAVAGAARLAAPLGLLDIPERQSQEVLRWDFDDGNGNLLIVGAGRSGKSTAVGTLLCSLAIGHQAGEIAVFCVDFGGESLLAFRELPQVAAVATRSDPELTRLVLSRLRTILDERETLFRELGFDSVKAIRRARAAGILDRSIPGAVVLIIDGWAGLQDAHPAAEAALQEVLSRGPGLGVHTVLTISAAGQLRTRLTAGFDGRIELRLGDCFDSSIDRQLAKALPVDRPGRALVAGRHYAQIALPRSGDSQQRLIDDIRQRWAGPGVPGAA